MLLEKERRTSLIIVDCVDFSLFISASVSFNIVNQQNNPMPMVSFLDRERKEYLKKKQHRNVQKNKIDRGKKSPQKLKHTF
jgi:hypothetical protein